ncbi:MAG TPA: S8 family serine peptidase [Gemmatimonadales bacterium]|nr:S8 family serine peptidase [Gemmatimonadales bacterium]
MRPVLRLSPFAGSQAGLLLALLAAGAAPALGQGAPAESPRPDRQPVAPPALAWTRGWMPLAATGIPQFLSAHPEWDGRGVLIGILDSGVDAGVAGLGSTSTGRPKILDLRDFSGEGTILLSVVTPSPRQDTVALAGHRLAGMRRVRGTAGGPWYAGFFRERALGQPPSSDVNDNGRDTDSLMVVVARASDGWILFADTDGDGSLANERPVRDYLQGRETFGWHRPGEPTPLTIAVNFSDRAPSASSAPSPPSVRLVFDTEAHGTHVAGIAAGRGIGGVIGFDGVAPGAQLLGLKISRNDFGGITTTGSVVMAMDYAIRFAASRKLPLVLNMSFGVGNEREGAARLDWLVDSILAAHPHVVFVTSAGNDGPGLSTLGFPGSARRAITVGGIQAAAFLPGPARAEPVLYFSSRGGELDKPDVVAPGTAYSTVPLWNRGDEFKSGTSMASPHVAGLAALLASAALDQRRSVAAEDLRRALRGSARPSPAQTAVDAGAGLPDVTAAWGILEGPAPAAEFDVDLPGRPGATAAFAIGNPDTSLTFRITRRRGDVPMNLAFSSDAPWLAAPGPIRFDRPTAAITVRQTSPAQPGTYTGTVRARAEGVAGTVFSLVSTVIVPLTREASPFRAAPRIPPGGQHRVTFAADSGRPFFLRVEAGGRSEQLIAALHQPGGQPILGDNGIPGGPDTLAAVYDVDGRDARAGFYEAVAVAPPDQPVTARFTVAHSPVGLRVAPVPPDSMAVTLRVLTDSATSGLLRFGMLGAERTFQVDAQGSRDVTVAVTVPSWAEELIADLELEPAQWPDFTDFGFAAVDQTGRILEKEPANYSRTRMSVALPSRPAGETVNLVLAPGFADPESRASWQARVTVRLHAAQPAVLAARGGDAFQLAPRATTQFHSWLGPTPWPLPPGFRPLFLFIVEGSGSTWTWQLPLTP